MNVNTLLPYLPKDIAKRWMQSEKKVFSKGEFIMSPGDPFIYIVTKGTAQIFSLHPDGKECVISLVKRGECIGILEMFSKREQKRFARALMPTEVIALPTPDVQKIIAKTPDILLLLLHDVTEQLEESLDVLEQVAYGKVEERLLFLLNKISEKVGDQECRRLPNYLTHRDLASMIASTRETVTFLMNKFLHDGKIIQKNNTLWLKK